MKNIPIMEDKGNITTRLHKIEKTKKCRLLLGLGNKT